MSPRIIEIIGPAGAGKTTLCRALSPCKKSFHIGNFPDVRKISNVPFFIKNGFQILPTLLKLPRDNCRKLTRPEFAWISILNGWSEILQKEGKNKIVILDQGPVFLLTETREFGPEYLRNGKADFLWQGLYPRWGNTLDMIVWLDAPNADLMSRIRHRDKGHVVKNESDATTFEFFARYRQAYERTISNLQTNNSDLKILRFDTSQKSSDEIAYQLLFEFGTH